ncbi:MAG: WbqC family protein [Candidatus Altimarinota bacterium]
MIDLWKHLNHGESLDSMICSIHQPNYIPYLGLFHKLAQSDVFVFYDTAQYTKGDYHNRNTIKGPNGPILLSLPAQVKLGQLISEVQFDSRVLPKHLKTIQESYKKSKFFLEVLPIVEQIYAYTGSSLAEFNIVTIKKLVDVLGIKTKLVLLSEISSKLETRSTEALIDICKILGAHVYISGAGGRGYLEPELFVGANIKLEFQHFEHPVYPQLWGEFLPYMSIIDVLFNVGIEDTKKLIS